MRSCIRKNSLNGANFKLFAIILCSKHSNLKLIATCNQLIKCFLNAGIQIRPRIKPKFWISHCERRFGWQTKTTKLPHLPVSRGRAHAKQKPKRGIEYSRNTAKQYPERNFETLMKSPRSRDKCHPIARQQFLSSTECCIFELLLAGRFCFGIFKIAKTSNLLQRAYPRSRYQGWVWTLFVRHIELLLQAIDRVSYTTV